MKGDIYKLCDYCIKQKEKICYCKNNIRKKRKYKKKNKYKLAKLAKYMKSYYKIKKESKAKRPIPEQCEVCGAIGKICFDHDHKTNKFRGWICIRCNVALGMVKDSSELLIKLSEYVNRSNY